MDEEEMKKVASLVETLIMMQLTESKPMLIEWNLVMIL
jgi:hypothetical protein